MTRRDVADRDAVFRALHAEKADLAAPADSVEARNDAILRALPDLMFILRRDGTYVDYHARDSTLLFVQPSAFIGRNVRDVLPPPLGDAMMNALQRASRSHDPVVVEYELPMGEPQSFEARIVQLDGDRLLSIVRDVTALKRASELNRELARRLISSQEVERQRIARELHDDISQRIAMLNIEIDQIATQVDSEQSRLLRLLSAEAAEIAVDVHRMSYELHPSKLQMIGLTAALRSLCSDVSKQRHLDVVFTHGPMPASVEENVSLCLYRIVQEALHNVARHSHATGAQVSVTCENGQIAVQVADAGIGFDPERVADAGLGLVSIRERAAALDGRLTIDAGPGRGTRITVRIPLASRRTNAVST
jgi:signal transduction histidine kinase